MSNSYEGIDLEALKYNMEQMQKIVTKVLYKDPEDDGTFTIYKDQSFRFYIDLKTGKFHAKSGDDLIFDIYLRL